VIKKIIMGMVLSIIILLVILSFSIDGIVKGAIESTGSKVLGTQVTVQNVALSLFDGRGTIKGLVIANPTGFKEPYLFKLGTVNVAVSIPSLLSDTIVVNNISISHPTVMFETNANTSNIQTVLKHIEQSTDNNITHNTTSEIHKTHQTKQPTVPSKNLIIKHLALTKPIIKGNLGWGLATVNMQIPDVVLNDIGDKQGVSAQSAAQQIIHALTNSLSHAKTQVKATKKGERLEQFLQDVGDLLQH